MSAFKTLIYEKKESVASVTLNRPEALNAFNVQMRDDLYEVLGAIIDDPDVRVVIFRGAGEKAFCAGADLKEFLGAPPPVAARHVRFRRDPWGLFQKVPQPIIAALHGYVLGSGIEIALCCDIRIASEDVRIGLPEVGLGIIPAAGGTQTLPRIVGRARALEMLLADRWLGRGGGISLRAGQPGRGRKTGCWRPRRNLRKPSLPATRWRSEAPNRPSSGGWIFRWRRDWIWRGDSPQDWDERRLESRKEGKANR